MCCYPYFDVTLKQKFGPKWYLNTKQAQKQNFSPKNFTIIQLDSKISENFEVMIFFTFSLVIPMKIKPIKCIYGKTLSLKFQVSRPQIG